METTTRNLLDVVTEDRDLPEGTDMWTIRTICPDFRSQRGFRWPFPGQWAEAPGPIIKENTSACPSTTGDGICVATTWSGMASAMVPARTLLLCAINTADLLSGTEEDKVRVSRALVVDVIDGLRLVRDHGSGADLDGAYLTGVDLRGANLRGANLYEANLRHADLDGAYLTGVDLRGASLYGAYLTGVDLGDASLYGANLREYAKTQGAILS